MNQRELLFTGNSIKVPKYIKNPALKFMNTSRNARSIENTISPGTMLGLGALTLDTVENQHIIIASTPTLHSSISEVLQRPMVNHLVQ